MTNPDRWTRRRAPVAGAAALGALGARPAAAADLPPGRGLDPATLKLLVDVDSTDRHARGEA